MTPIATLTELRYNIRAVRNCILIARFLGWWPLVRKYQKYLVRAERELARTKTALSMSFWVPIREKSLSRKIMPVDCFPSEWTPSYMVRK